MHGRFRLTVRKPSIQDPVFRGTGAAPRAETAEHFITMVGRCRLTLSNPS
jgi:hypothetical protein